MLQNIKDAKNIELLIDSKSDAVTLGGDTSVHIDVAITESTDMWGECKTPSSSTTSPTPRPSPSPTPPHHTHTNKRKRKLEEAVSLFVEHVTKVPVASPDTASLTQLILTMQATQTQMMASIQQLQSQIQQQKEQTQ